MNRMKSTFNLLINSVISVVFLFYGIFGMACGSVSEQCRKAAREAKGTCRLQQGADKDFINKYQQLEVASQTFMTQAQSFLQAGQANTYAQLTQVAGNKLKQLHEFHRDSCHKKVQKCKKACANHDTVTRCITRTDVLRATCEEDEKAAQAGIQDGLTKANALIVGGGNQAVDTAGN